jgi:hypothetical protein
VFQVLADQRDRRPVHFHKKSDTGSPGKRFNADGAGPGEQVEKTRPGDLRRQNVKKGAAGLVS